MRFDICILQNDHYESSYHLSPSVSSVQSLSLVWLFAASWLQHARLPCPSPTPRVYSNSCPACWWCHPTISSSFIPLSSCLQSFPASGSFPMSQLFASGGQSIGASLLASVLPMNIQNWFSLGWTGWISLQSKGLSRVFSNTTVQKHQFFGAQLSLKSSSHIHPSPDSHNCFFFWMKIFKIWIFNSFQIYNTVLLIIVTMRHNIFPRLIYFITRNLYLLIPFTQYGISKMSFWACFLFCYSCLLFYYIRFYNY